MTSLTSTNSVAGPTGLLGRLVDNSAVAKARMDRFAEQSSTGLVSQNYAGLEGTAQLSLDLRPQLARIDAFTQNITTANTRLDVSSHVLDQLHSIAITFFSGSINMTSQSSQEVDALATQATAALGQVQDLLNTKIGGTYLFAGQDSSNAPLPDNAFKAFITSIKAATSGLATAGGTATAQATLAAANTGSPFSSTLGNEPQSMSVGFGNVSTVGIVAGHNSYAVQAGAPTTNSYIKDLLRSLATISSLNAGQAALGSNFSALVTDTRTSLNNQIAAISTESAGLGNSKKFLETNQTTLSDMQSVMTQQISVVENVDAAATASALTQAQMQLQVSYKLISSMQDLSLVHYL